MKIFSWALITLGSFLEVYYYIFRFENDGVPLPIAIIMGAALTLMLALAVIRKEKKFIIPLIVYSVLATSAGQAFSFDTFKNKMIKSEVSNVYTLENIEDTKNQIKTIDQEISDIKEDINKTITSLEDRYEWKNTTAGAESRLDELKKDREKKKIYLDKITQNATITSEIKPKKRTIYEFYNNLLFGLVPEDILQFIFQTALSFFIACMAPLGIMSLKNTESKPKIKKEKETVNIDSIIERWVDINWMGVHSGKSTKIILRDTYEKFTRSRGEALPKGYYEKLRSAAEKTGMIQQDGTVTEPDKKKVFNKIRRVVDSL